MTELVNGMNQGTNTTSIPESGMSSSSSTSAPVSSSDRHFTQVEVNDIVKRAKNDAVDSYRRLQVEQPQYLNQKYGVEPQNNNHTSNNDDSLRKIAAEEAQKHFESIRQDAYKRSQDEAAQKTVMSFFNKINAGKEKYSDFDKVIGDIEYAKFPNVVQLLADHVDNSHDVLYELGKDRMKLANIEQLANMSPKDALVYAQRLSQSIKDNDSAKNVKVPNEPLSQMRPSNIGTDNGAKAVRDYRRLYKV